MAAASLLPLVAGYVACAAGKGTAIPADPVLAGIGSRLALGLVDGRSDAFLIPISVPLPITVPIRVGLPGRPAVFFDLAARTAVGLNPAVPIPVSIRVGLPGWSAVVLDLAARVAIGLNPAVAIPVPIAVPVTITIPVAVAIPILGEVGPPPPAVAVPIEVAVAIVAVPIVADAEDDGRNAERPVILRIDIDAALLVGRLHIASRHPAAAAVEFDVAPGDIRKAAVDFDGFSGGNDGFSGGNDGDRRILGTGSGAHVDVRRRIAFGRLSDCRSKHQQAGGSDFQKRISHALHSSFMRPMGRIAMVHDGFRQLETKIERP